MGNSFQSEGTLKVAELQISGLEPAEWTKHGDMWEELKR